jgi:hypothetical protein
VECFLCLSSFHIFGAMRWPYLHIALDCSTMEPMVSDSIVVIFTWFYTPSNGFWGPLYYCIGDCPTSMHILLGNTFITLFGGVGRCIGERALPTIPILVCGWFLKVIVGTSIEEI